MAGILSEFMEERAEDMEDELGLAYRVNSSFVEKRNIPRDIVIQFVTSGTIDDFLRQQFKTPLEIGGKKILILKEIPKKALLYWKKYKKYKKVKKYWAEIHTEVQKILQYDYPMCPEIYVVGLRLNEINKDDRVLLLYMAAAAR